MTRKEIKSVIKEELGEIIQETLVTMVSEEKLKDTIRELINKEDFYIDIDGVEQVERKTA